MLIPTIPQTPKPAPMGDPPESYRPKPPPQKPN